MSKKDDISTILIKEEHVRLMEDMLIIKANMDAYRETLNDNKKALAEKLGVKAKIANEIFKKYESEGNTGDELKLSALVNSAVEQAHTIRDSMKK